MLISRVASHCFWLGRYLERAESTARSLGSTREALMGADLEEPMSWMPIVIAAGEEERFTELFTAADPGAATDGELVQRYMVWDERNPSSLRASVAAVRANARSIRDHLSLALWEQINAQHWWWAEGRAAGSPRPSAARALWDSDRHAFYARQVESMAMTAGLLHTTMLRDQPFDFIMLGTMLERASQTARIIDVQHHALELNHPHVVIRTVLWLALLRSCAGYDAFMRRHRGRVTGQAVATFLIQDLRFPRSVGFALAAALERLGGLRSPQADADGRGSSHERLAGLVDWLTARAPQQLVGQAVHEALTHVVDEVHAIANEVGAEFLGCEAIEPEPPELDPAAEPSTVEA